MKNCDIYFILPFSNVQLCDVEESRTGRDVEQFLA